MVAGMIRPALALMLAVQPAFAAEPITAEAFEAHTAGKTMYYGDAGGPYGVEEYLENRRVRWSFLDGECKEGRWYADLDLICFVYEDNPEPQCWSFYLDGGRLTAVFENDPNTQTLYQINESDKPMQCLGPRIGV